jgi:hypothetical protein
MEEIKEASLETLEQPKLKEDAEFFIEEEDHPSVPNTLDFLKRCFETLAHRDYLSCATQ